MAIRVATALTLAILSTAITAQFRQRIDLVTIDALVVNDSGEPVTDLSAQDFEVLVDGKPRRVVAFRRVAHDAKGRSGSSPSRRVAVLVVERDQIRPHEGQSFFEAGAAFIDTLAPEDHVAIWTIPAHERELRLLRDHEVTKRRLREMRGSAPPASALINITPDEAVSIVFHHDEVTLGEATARECGRHANAGPVCRQEIQPLPVQKATEPLEASPPQEVEDLPASPSGDRVSGALLAALADYIQRFEKEFSSAVAEERYVQLIRPARESPSKPSDEPALEWFDGENWHEYPRKGVIVERRQLLSDVLLVHTPQGWLGYRDVEEVDGRAVRGRSERVSRLFLSRDADRDDQLRRIAAESARYNIGGFTRTLNIPTLPLFFLRGQNHSRFTFASAGREQLDGMATEVISYEEHGRPTLIGDRNGEDVPISGRIWIDSTSRAVVQTEIRVLSGERRNARRGTLITRYRHDPRFQVLVPGYMWEWYDGGVANIFGSVFARTVVEGMARYTDYRKFSVTTRESSR